MSIVASGNAGRSFRKELSLVAGFVVPAAFYISMDEQYQTYAEVEQVKQYGTIMHAALSHASNLYKNGDYREAMRICDALLLNDESYASGGPFLLKMQSLYALGKLDSVVDEYAKYINDSDDTDQTLKYAYYNRGKVLEELGRRLEAKEMYQKATELDPTATGPRLALLWV